MIRLAKGIIPNYLVFSPIFLGIPVYSDFLVRKDVVGILLLALALLTLKKFDGVWKYLAANTLLVVALLNHESILFYGIPLVLLTDILRSKNVSWYRIMLSYFPALLAAIFVLAYRGNAETANLIAVFWNSFFEENYPKFCCLNEHPAAINAIGWTTWQGLSLSLGLLDDFENRIIYVPAAWLVTIFVYIQLGNWAMNGHDGRRFVAIFLVQLFFVSPLFLLGWDLGRWIFYISTSSLIWVSLFREFNISQGRLYRLVDWLYLKSPLTRKEVGLIGLSFGVPRCCWSLHNAIVSTPLGDNLYVLYSLLKNF